MIGPRWRNVEDIQGDVLNLLLRHRRPGEKGPCNLENTMLSEGSQTQKNKYCVIPLDEISRTDTVTEKVE